MNRLRLILALSHGCLATGVLGLYTDPNSLPVALIGVGAFTRWMVPSKPMNVEKPLIFTLRYGLVMLLTYWLLDNGLSELIENPWHDRLSIRPVIFFTSVLFSLVVKDWIYFTRLSPGEIDAFYNNKT
jgi:hypothetical protein